MDKTVSDEFVREVIALLRMRAEIMAIMRGPHPEAEILHWLLDHRATPASQSTQFNIGPLFPKGELPIPADESEVEEVGRALRARLMVVEGGRKKRGH